MNICHGNCDVIDFKEKYNTRKSHKNSYRLGYKRCRICDMYIKHNDNRCPCCRSLLATNPKNNKTRREKLEQLQVHRY